MIDSITIITRLLKMNEWVSIYYCVSRFSWCCSSVQCCSNWGLWEWCGQQDHHPHHQLTGKPLSTPTCLSHIHMHLLSSGEDRDGMLKTNKPLSPCLDRLWLIHSIGLLKVISLRILYLWHGTLVHILATLKRWVITKISQKFNSLPLLINKQPGKSSLVQDLRCVHSLLTHWCTQNP